MADQSWSEEGAFEVAPGVFRIPLPLPTDVLRAVNVYAVVDGERLALVDGGWAITAAHEQLERSLAKIGFGVPDIRRFFVTHIHRDHYTQAIALRQLHGSQVGLGEHERPSLEEIIAARRRGHWRYPAMARLRRSGALDLGERISRAVADEEVDDFNELPDIWFADGDVLTLDDRTLQVVHTPGHTAGHVVFVDEKAGALFAGDHVLPHITPSIGLESAPTSMPLADYLTSLAAVRALPDRRLFPAHGPVTDSVHRRVDELLTHHEDRFEATLAALADGASTALEAAGILRWTRRGRHLDELDLFNTTLAVTETLAHLDVLAARGEVTVSTDADGADHFVRV